VPKDRIISILICLLLTNNVFCQINNPSNNLIKGYYPLSYNLSLRYDHYLSSGGYFFWENSAFSTHKPFFPDTYPLNITDVYSWIGYENPLSEKWYLGGSLKYIDLYYDKSFIARANISHRGRLKSLFFIKEMSLEREKYLGRNNSIPIGGWGFMTALGKDFSFFENHPTYIFLSCRLIRNFYFNDDNFVFRNRRFNQSNMRLEITQNVSRNIYLGIFAARETQYLYLFSMNYQGRYNRIAPIVGFRANYIFNSDIIKDLVPNLPGR
jgi:hypothetical protein